MKGEDYNCTPSGYNSMGENPVSNKVAHELASLAHYVLGCILLEETHSTIVPFVLNPYYGLILIQLSHSFKKIK
jgi:hypothetical protein